VVSEYLWGRHVFGGEVIVFYFADVVLYADAHLEKEEFVDAALFVVAL
jgi:hypothetical protein